MRRYGMGFILVGAAALMLALTVTTVQGMKQHETPGEAIAHAPKLVVDQVKSSMHKLAMEVKPKLKPRIDKLPQEAEAPGGAQQTVKQMNIAASTVPSDAKAFELWDNDKFFASYDTFVEAVQIAKSLPNARVTYKSQSALAWSKDSGNKGQVHIDVELIEQMPELERGCEVTALSMLLKSAGIDADKTVLAQQVKKDPTPFEYVDGKIHYGNPNDGFVGDIETFDNPGFGVYHGPVKELADQYLPGRAVDMTGADFTDMYTFLDQGIPVWTIVNMDFEPLSEADFERWQTPSGPIDITYKEHSVLVTGYDAEYIYINDPLNEADKVNKDSFVAAWEQMGKQAISYVPNIETKAGKS